MDLAEDELDTRSQLCFDNQNLIDLTIADFKYQWKTSSYHNVCFSQAKRLLSSNCDMSKISHTKD